MSEEKTTLSRPLSSRGKTRFFTLSSTTRRKALTSDGFTSGTMMRRMDCTGEAPLAAAASSRTRCT